MSAEAFAAGGTSGTVKLVKIDGVSEALVETPNGESYQDQKDDFNAKLGVYRKAMRSLTSEMAESDMSSRSEARQLAPLNKSADALLGDIYELNELLGDVNRAADAAESDDELESLQEELPALEMLIEEQYLLALDELIAEVEETSANL